MYRFMFYAGCGFLLVHASVAGAQQRVSDTPLVLGRGPIHEAFAEVVTFDPRPGIGAPRKPPELIQELPPEIRPTGSRVQWMPGYWAWDEERNDFIWVSGGWRNAPPNRRWVPGYWAGVSNGYQWISGFWEVESTEHIRYLPVPPQSVEQGPTSTAPSIDHFWVPGAWVWRDASFVWRPGFWSQTSPGWIWIPAHYRYTPRGIVYVNGYWDHDLTRRGNLYAPVYYPRPVYAQAGFYHRPTSLVELGLLTASLFVQPEHHHYYYGDYYAPRHRDRGYYPWYGYSSAQRGFDPLFSYYAWQHRNRNDNDWRASIEREYQQRRDQPSLRPPHVIERGNVTRQKAAKPIVRIPDDAPRDRDSERLEPRPSDATREWIEQLRQLRRDRREAEQTEPQGVRPPRVVSPKERRQTQPVQEPPKQTRPAAPPSDSAPRADVPRWRIPDRGQQVGPGNAGDAKFQTPARPEPPKQQPSPGPKPESILSRKKSKGNK